MHDDELTLTAFKLYPSMLDALDREAERRGMSRSALIRLGIAKVIPEGSMAAAPDVGLREAKRGVETATKALVVLLGVLGTHRPGIARNLARDVLVAVEPYSKLTPRRKPIVHDPELKRRIERLVNAS